MTEKTIHLAGRWQAGYHPEEYSSEAWFFGMARYTYLTARNRWKPHPRGLTSENPTPLSDLAHLTQLSTLLGRLPSETADALVLACFAGLSSEEIGEILGLKETRANRLVEAGLKRLQRATPTAGAWINQDGKGTNLAANLEQLSQSIQPNPDWLSEVREQSLADRPRSLPKLFLWLAGSPFRWLTLLHSINNWIRYLPILVVCGMALAWWFGSRPASPGPAVPAVEPALAANFSITDSASSPLTTGYLVPPDPAVCQNWQALFAKKSPGRVTLRAPVSYLDPTIDAHLPEGEGMACLVEALGSGLDFPDPQASLQTYLALLKEGGFQTKGQCDPDRQNNCFFGSWYTLQNGSLQAFLFLAWFPLDPNDCPNDSACQPPAERKQYALSLQIATDSTHTVLETFFNAWIQGDNAALDSLAPELRKGTPSIDALDALVGIRRTPADSLALTWSVVENTGSRLRLAVHWKVNGGQAFLFQVILTNLDRQWKVSTIATGIIFPSSSDGVYWAGQDGAIYRYTLADKTLQPLTSPGIYSPQREDQPEGVPPTPPEISPDGRWLALYPPGSTLLVDLQNEGMVIRLPQTGSLAWTRDGSRIAFVEKDRPVRNIYTLAEPFSGQPSILARLPDDPVSLAWSPDGNQLAVLAIRAYATTPVPSPTQPAGGAETFPPIELREVSVIDAGSGKVRDLATLRCPASLAPNPFDLAWTRNGQEIWYRSFRLAISTQDGATLALVFNRESTVSESIQDSVLFPKVLASGRPSPMNLDIPVVSPDLVSPDGRWITANPAWAPNGYVNQISIAPADNELQTNGSVFLRKNLYSLAWTQDSQNLVAGGGREYQVGPIFRLSAATGEGQLLADGVFWIGVGSDLQARSLAQAPESSTEFIPADLNADWTCQSLALDVACIRAPPGWKTVVFPAGGYLGHWMITNLAFPAPIGWTSRKAGTVSIEIYNLPGTGEKSPQDILQGLPLTLIGNLWEPVSVDGVTGVHVLSRYDPEQSDVFYPTSRGLLQMGFYIALEGNFKNPVVQKILQSIQFK